MLCQLSSNVFAQRAPFLLSRRYCSTKHLVHDVSARPPVEVSAMARLPTKALLRSLLLTSLMSSKFFFRPALAILGLISTSKSALLNPDRNLILNKILRWTVYNHVCAGTKRKEVSQMVADVKKLGYQGVILGYSKEIVFDPQDNPTVDESGSRQYNDRCMRRSRRGRKALWRPCVWLGLVIFLLLSTVYCLDCRSILLTLSVQTDRVPVRSR